MAFSEETELAILIVSGTISMLSMALLIVFFTIYSRKKILEKELENLRAEDQHKKDKELLSVKVGFESREKEKKEISKFLHDDVNMRLSMIHSISSKVGKNNPTLLAQLQELQNVKNSLRNLSHELLPAELVRYGFSSALNSLATRLSENSEIKFEIDNAYEEELNLLSPSSSKILFRIFQELFTNAIKHSKANTVQVSVLSDDANWLLSYYDNGTGLVNERNAGNGIHNIDTYIELLQGDINYQNLKNKGLEITVSFPKNKLNEEN